MSRIGKKPITIPAGVTVTIAEGNAVTVKGPKGTLSDVFSTKIGINVEGNVITLTCDNEKDYAVYGLTRTLLNNMIEGVDKEFSKTLEINGIGYRAQKQGKTLVLTLGYSHPVNVDEIPGITIDVPNPNTVVIHGPDKQQVGQFAADIRKKRPPEPYKGKGIKYAEEVIRRKEGKTGAKKK